MIPSKNCVHFQKLMLLSEVGLSFFRMRLLRFFSDIRINMQETVDLNFTSTFFLLPTFALILLSSSSFYSTLWMHEGFNSDLFMFFASNGQKVTFVHQNIIQPLKNSWNHYILGTWPPLSTSKAEYIHTIGYKSKIFRSQVKSFSKCNV